MKKKGGKQKENYTFFLIYEVTFRVSFIIFMNIMEVSGKCVRKIKNYSFEKMMASYFDKWEPVGKSGTSEFGKEKFP